MYLCYNTKVMKTIRLKQKLFTFIASTILMAGMFSGTVHALTSVQLQEQVNTLQSQINAGTAKAKELAQQADSLKKAVGALDIQIDQENARIEQTNLKIQDLQNKLNETQAELDRQKDLLKDSMRALYKKGGASPIELLIGSDSFSQFIDSQEYLTRLKSAIQTSTDKVIALKQEIQKQQFEQEELLKVQQAQKDAVAIQRNDRQALLDQTRGDEVRYRSLVADLRAQQVEVNRALFAQIQLERGNGNNGGYPYADYAFSMIPWGCGPGEGPDRWGYCTRQCVSYAAWAVERSGRQAPLYYGNAKNWVNAAPDAWQYNSPQAGDVGVLTGGSFGHVVYVETVYNNGTMRISQYNAQVSGEYSEATVSTNFANKYIRFP